MAFRELNQPIRGIVPPMVTPLAGPDKLDEAGLERLVEHLVGGGVHGLFILGSTGEGPSLSPQLQRQLVDRTCALVDGRVPVLVGITAPCLADSMALAAHSADAGADAVVASAPYYFPLDQADLLGYVRRLSAETPLPLTLYNMPALTKVTFELATIQQLVDVPTIVGMKDSSGDMQYLQSVCEMARARDDWSVFVGQEALLVQALEIGASGGVCGGANVHPRLFVQLYEATLATTETSIAEQGDVLPDLVDHADRLGKIFRVGGRPISAPTVVKGLKAALAVLGVCREDVATPFLPLSSVERDEVAAIVRELGLLPALAADRT
jgi:dihydrodipicolinate synthase/N-acetylneuraminate lyase